MIEVTEKPETAAAEPSFQIEPLSSPMFVIMQPAQGAEGFREAGYVWTFGSSRTNSQEHWFLYDTVPAGAGLQAYMWPGFNQSGRQVGAFLNLVPATPPAGQSPSTLKAYLEQTKRVSLTYIVATCQAGVSR